MIYPDIISARLHASSRNAEENEQSTVFESKPAKKDNAKPAGSAQVKVTYQTSPASALTLYRRSGWVAGDGG